MALILLLSWLAATASIWITVVSGVRSQAANENGIPQTLTRVVIVFGAFPPTAVFLISAFVLLLASPTAQFNTGSSYRMDLWSFWVDTWPMLFLSSELLAIVYFLWASIGFAVNRNHWTNSVLVCSFISVAFGWTVLRIAYPSA